MKRLHQVGWMIGLAFLFSLTFGGTAFAANRLDNMRIEVELQEDGSAVITEFREMEIDEGTEAYIVLDNLQQTELLDFSVAGFEEESDWDSNDSQAEKAGKYGVVDTGNGLELIWGVGEYGNNSYEVTYTLSNLVQELEDGQALLWNFDTFTGTPTENFTMQITGPEPFQQEDTDFWGFGFEGDIQLVDGTIQWEAFEEVNSGNDVTLLLQFPPATFNTQVTVNQTLEEQRQQAMEGPIFEEEGSDDIGPVGIGLIGLAVAGAISAMAGGIAYTVKLKKAKEAAGEIPDGAALIVENEGKTLDEAPYTGKDLPGIAYFMQNIYKGYFEDYFFAYLLRWESEGRIHVHTSGYETDDDEFYESMIEILNFAEESEQYPHAFTEVVRDLKKKQLDPYETGLWTMLLDAADETGRVGEERMNGWAKQHAHDVQTFQDYLLDYSKKYLEKNGYILMKEVEVWGRKHQVVTATEKGSALMTRLIQFDNYLEEVELVGFQDGNMTLSFADLLFWNVLFSRRDEITDQFEEMLDDGARYDQTTHFGYYYWYWYGMNGFHNNLNSGLASGGFHSHNASMYAGSSGSSGSGGFTSFGGGGGAGGGGGGGVR